MLNEPNSVSLERFFSGMAEYIFHSRMGVADTDLVDYLSHLLVRFSKTDAMHRVRQINGKPATEVVTMMAEAQQRIGLAKRQIHRHIGDFTLFWSGMYPEALRELQGPNRRDQFVSYCEQGKIAYEIAAEIEPDEDEAPSDLLRKLSDEFEMCAYGLREIRREWESPDETAGQNIIIL
jgi:hypothetical protein